MKRIVKLRQFESCFYHQQLFINKLGMPTSFRTPFLVAPKPKKGHKAGGLTPDLWSARVAALVPSRALRFHQMPGGSSYVRARWMLRVCPSIKGLY